MNTQRREEILALIADQNGTHAMDDYRAALIDAMDWISQLEAKAAERVIADGSKGPTPDYTGEGSAWIPPKTKPHTFAQMVNEVRDLAFDFGTCEQFRDRVSELLGKYVDADGKAPGVVVPEYPEDDLAIRESIRDAGGDPYFDKTVHRAGWMDLASRVRAIPADRVLGEGMVQVDAARLAALESISAKIESLALGPDGRAWTPLHYREFARGELRAALRANQGGATT